MEDLPYAASDTITVGGGAMSAAAPDFDPMLLSVLSSRFGAILREMSNGVLRASKSGVIKIARDMSCAILTYDHRLVCIEECIPVHAAAIDLTTRPLTELFDDIEEGDAFLNNCPYTGVTHHADLTLCVPVFFNGKPLFWTVSRAHHADVGAPIPSTYLPYAKTIYEEGLHFPGVRVEQGYKELRDIIRMARIKVRVPDLWYGDYLAQVGACRTAERRIKELVEKYGPETIAEFVEAWMAYGERRAAAAIRTMPAGTWSYENRHDPLPGVADEGIPVRAKVTVDPGEAMVTVDVRDNIDCIPSGLNLSETCSIAACRAGVFYNIDHTIPHNEGSARRIRVLLRDGCIVGRPRYPVGTSVATTNVTDRLV
ncbi:MAG: hydantoinase B/oxoprolinase family protein, partial [Rhodospirillales bacterium]|nr:hydantoinase B/oxoprolinase family protein [Rhodospirillales bacterium]